MLQYTCNVPVLLACYVSPPSQERVQLTRLVTERSIVPLVAGTCDRLASSFSRQLVS